MSFQTSSRSMSSVARASRVFPMHRPLPRAPMSRPLPSRMPFITTSGPGDPGSAWLVRAWDRVGDRFQSSMADLTSRVERLERTVEALGVKVDNIRRDNLRLMISVLSALVGSIVLVIGTSSTGTPPVPSSSEPPPVEGPRRGGWENWIWGWKKNKKNFFFAMHII
ncbi:hypothetical protein GGR54DRAFT_604442 [Hypoxylon sp. NC1633]|nr:hypothetical protein GGR54DRAFT_604442 [Hypoxylon sp. NC1633]